MQLPIDLPGMRQGVDRPVLPTRRRTDDAEPARAAIDSAEFARRLDEASAALFRFTRKLCGERSSADDLGQETARRALERRSSYDPSRPLAPWLFRIAFRLWLDRRERGRPPSVELGVLFAPVRDPGESMRLREAVGRLPQVEREILVGFHVRRDSIAELASRLGMPENTVKSHLHRARARIMDELEER